VAVPKTAPSLRQMNNTDDFNSTNARFPCGSSLHEDEQINLPPPLPEPKYSVHKRVLPASLTAFSSPEGKRLLIESFADGTAESYWKLTEQFVNQSDPAFCGVTTLLMCLNAMCIDPNVRWRGGWRFYGSEEVLLDRCCQSTERIRRSGITMEDFSRMGKCHGLNVELKRPICDGNVEHRNGEYSVTDFRNDVRSILSDTSDHQPLLVTSFSRQALGQTGDGHFSPIAAYHDGTDQVLVLDVARFKYSPYWVSLQDLYHSMQVEDSVTKKSRGWFSLHPPKNHACSHQTHEDRRPVELVPTVGEGDICPVGPIKIDFCKSNSSQR
jgi:glutathione gamma-glutamylcysteinyltransferase